MRLIALRFFFFMLIRKFLITLAFPLCYKIECERYVISPMNRFSQELMS